jgi:hypothetical protein
MNVSLRDTAKLESDPNFFAANPIPASRLVLIARCSQPAHSLAEVLLVLGQQARQLVSREAACGRAVPRDQGSPRRR